MPRPINPYRDLAGPARSSTTPHEDNFKIGSRQKAEDSIQLLMVTPRYLPFVGGVENHVSQVARRLVVAGVHVTVLTTDTTGQLSTAEVADGVQIIRVRARPAKTDYYFAPDIYRVISAGPWDLVHVQSYHTFVAPIAMLASLRAHLPYVVTFHGGGHSSRVRHSLRGLQQWALRPLLVRAERLIALAEFEIELLGKRLHLERGRFVLIPNGYDFSRTKPTARTESNAALIASVGRLERYKGHQRLVAALPDILARRPDARLWIAGTGPYESELRRQAGRLGVADRVEFRAIPSAEREMMAEELSKADLVVLLSEYETHPMAVLEALALGRPVLVADTSGLHELAQAGLVRAIPLDSTPGQIASAVLGQLREPLIPPPIDLPTWDDCASKLLALYSSIVRSPRCAS